MFDRGFVERWGLSCRRDLFLFVVFVTFVALRFRFGRV